MTMRIFNINMHDDNDFVMRLFFESCGAEWNSATVELPSEDGVPPTGIPLGDQAESFKQACLRGDLVLVSNWNHYIKLLTQFPCLMKAKVASGTYSHSPDYGGITSVISSSTADSAPGRDLLVIPRRYNLSPDSTLREQNRVSSMINGMHRFEGSNDFVRLMFMLHHHGITLTNYGVPNNPLLGGNDVAMMRRSMATTHIRFNGGTPNAVCKSIAVGTPVFMLTKHYSVAGLESILGIVCKDTIEELKDAILDHCHEPKQLLKLTEDASVENQMFTTEHIEAGKSWLQRAFK